MFHIAGSESEMISLQDFPAVTVTVVGDRKISPAPGANQIAGFSGYRPLTNREKNKCT